MAPRTEANRCLIIRPMWQTSSVHFGAGSFDPTPVPFVSKGGQVCTLQVALYLSTKFVKVVVRAEILPRNFLPTLGNYYVWLTIAKIQRLKKFYR